MTDTIHSVMKIDGRLIASSSSSAVLLDPSSQKKADPDQSKHYGHKMHLQQMHQVLLKIQLRIFQQSEQCIFYLLPLQCAVSTILAKQIIPELSQMFSVIEFKMKNASLKSAKMHSKCQFRVNLTFFLLFVEQQLILNESEHLCNARTVKNF